MKGRGKIAFFNILGSAAFVIAVATFVITTNLINVAYFFLVSFIMFSLSKFFYSRLPEEDKERDKALEKSGQSESENKLSNNVFLKGKFSETRRIGQLSIDENNGLFAFDSIKISFGHFDSKIFETKNFVSYNVRENGSEVTSGGLSVKRALVGSALLGPTGMVMGGLTGKKTSRSMVDTTDLVFSTVESPYNRVQLIKKPVQIGTVAHINVTDELNGIIEYFESILEVKRPVELKTDTENDNIALLREYKTLLDDGIISQIEFDDKKKKLL